MTDREILTATLRWHTAHTIRLEAGTASNKFKVVKSDSHLTALKSFQTHFDFYLRCPHWAWIQDVN